jgi:hypothetical protein
MSRREIMKHSAAQEANGWEEEDQDVPDGQGETPTDPPAEVSEKLMELDARQARVEAHLVKIMPSAKQAEKKFAEVVLAGKELRDEMAEHREKISASLKEYSAEVTKAGDGIKGEFQYQLQMLKGFLTAAREVADENEKLVERCQKMVETSSGIYNKGSAAVQDVSEKTRAHLKATAEKHGREIEAQAQHFKTIYKRMILLIVVGAVVIFLSALAAGFIASRMWADREERREPGPIHSNSGPPTFR